MKMQQFVPMWVLALSVAVSASAQAPVTTADLSRLQTTANEIGKQVEVLKKTDATLGADQARTLQGEQDLLEVGLGQPGPFGDVPHRVGPGAVAVQGEGDERPTGVVTSRRHLHRR